MAKVIKAAVTKLKVRTSKGVKEPWQIWYADPTTGFHKYSSAFTIEKHAKDYVRRYPGDATVIVYVNIPKIEY